MKLKEDIYWVGAIDWNLRNFHGYLTPRGTTYNAYLIIDEKITLIDTAKEPFKNELIERISKIVDPKKIDYVIFNHVEMDHSGSLPAIRAAAPNATFVADKRAATDLNLHYKGGYEFKIVKSGDILSLGKRNLHFVEVPMVHWPDSMMTYCPEEKILFSNDAFGQHLAGFERFDDEHDLSDILDEAAKYYANIVMPFAGPTTKALQAAGSLDIQMIAPSHGVVWRKNVGEIVSAYKDWSSNKTLNKAVVVYDTMWNSTEAMAKVIAEEFSAAGIATKLFNLRFSDTSEIIKEVLMSKYIVVGSPTLNNGMLPTVAGFLCYLKGLKPKGRTGFAFGSYGWSGGACQAIESELTQTGIELISEPLDCKYVPGDNILLEISSKVSSVIATLSSAKGKQSPI